MRCDGDRGGSSEGEQGFLFIDIPERPTIADFAKMYFRALICTEGEGEKFSDPDYDNSLRLFRDLQRSVRQ